MKRNLTPEEIEKDPLLKIFANAEPLVGWAVYIGLFVYLVLTWNFIGTVIAFLIYTFIISPFFVELVFDKLMMLIYYLIRGFPQKD